MRISDWSSDVCSSDLGPACGLRRHRRSDQAGASQEGLKGELMFVTGLRGRGACVAAIGSADFISLLNIECPPSWPPRRHRRRCQSRPARLTGARKTVSTPCGENGWQYVKISVVAVNIIKK